MNAARQAGVLCGGRPAAPSLRPAPAAVRRPRPVRRCGPSRRRATAGNNRADRQSVATPSARAECAAIRDAHPRRLGAGRVEDRLRQHALGQVVERSKPRRECGGDAAGPEQPFEGVLGVAPAPPAAASPCCRRSRRRRSGRGLDLAVHTLDVVRLARGRTAPARHRCRLPRRRAACASASADRSRPAAARPRAPSTRTAAACGRPAPSSSSASG